jgi:hypothetical protein
MPTTSKSHDVMLRCSDTSTRGLLRDARSDVQEVLEDRMEEEVGEGRKEGWLTVADIYIIT